MDTNALAAIVSALQAAQHQAPVDGANYGWVVQLGIALAVAFTAWQGNRTHKAVNSTASALASQKLVADEKASEQTYEIATMRQKLVGLDKASVVASGGVPVEVPSTSSVPVTAVPVSASFSPEQLTQIKAVIQAEIKASK